MTKLALPEEYVEGWTEFLGVRIDLSKRPLIPRPETEYWVEQLLKSVPRDTALRFLDMFTGSGCIGISIASSLPLAKVVLSDKKDYVATALKANTNLVIGDLFKGIEGKFDYILANPPYVAIGKGIDHPAADGVNIMDHEPKEALYAGADGLDVIRQFLDQAREFLNPRGYIWMEFGSDQKEAVTEILRELNYYQDFNCVFHKDQYGAWRYLVISS